MAHVLVIDDQSHICTIIEHFLTAEGHTSDLAENGKVGMQLAELNAYDLVITDIVMPEQDGLEVIMGFKKLYPHVKIIAMTGGTARLNSGSLLTTAHFMGVDRVLAKPLDFVKLLTAVNEVLEIRA